MLKPFHGICLIVRERGVGPNIVMSIKTRDKAIFFYYNVSDVVEYILILKHN